MSSKREADKDATMNLFYVSLARLQLKIMHH
jgi:hypothetical protein